MSEVDAAIAATRALIAKDEKIERLEAELADLRKQRNEMLQEVTTWRFRAEKSDERLADLRASSVVVRVRCDLGVTDNAKGEWVHRDDCPYDCDNGWQLAEGVRKITHRVSDDGQFSYPISGYFIPARLIEGDTDE